MGASPITGASDRSKVRGGNVVRVDVVQALHPIVGHGDGLAPGQSQEDARIEVALWIERRPAAAADVARVEDGARERQLDRADLAQQVLFDVCLALSVLAERRPVRPLLQSGRRNGRPVRPD